MDGVQSDKVNINLGGGDGGGGMGGMAALIAAMNSGGGDNNLPGLIAALGNNRGMDPGTAAMLAGNQNNGMNNLWPIILLALLGRGRGGLLGGDGGDCGPIAGGVSPGQAALLQTILETVGATRAAVPQAALETQIATANGLSALALASQQGFANVKDTVQNTSGLQLGATAGVKDAVQNAFAILNQNILDQGCKGREATAASTTAILQKIDQNTIDDLRHDRDRFERQVEVNSLRSQVEVNQTVNTTQAQAQQQGQFQFQFQDVNNRIARLCDAVERVHQVAQATNSNIIAGNTGAVTTGLQNSSPTNVNARGN